MNRIQQLTGRESAFVREIRWPERGVADLDDADPDFGTRPAPEGADDEAPLNDGARTLRADARKRDDDEEGPGADDSEFDFDEFGDDEDDAEEEEEDLGDDDEGFDEDDDSFDDFDDEGEEEE